MNKRHTVARMSQARLFILPYIVSAVLLILFLLIIGASKASAITSIDAVARECKASSIIGHRGTKVSGVKENTMSAFRKAVTDGASVIEVDIHRTKTSKKTYQWVIAHDKTIIGMNGKAYSIKHTTFATLKKYRPDIVTLDQFLGYMRTTNRRAFIEIKPTSITKSAAKKLGAKINAHKMTSRTEIHSFHEKVLRKFNKYKRYGIRTGYIVNSASNLNKGAGRINDFANSLVLRNDLVKSAAQIRGYKANKLNTYIYTLNSVSAWQRYSGYGLTGIITDSTGVYKTWCRGIQPKPPAITPPVTPTPPITPPPVEPIPDPPPTEDDEPPSPA